MIITIFNQKGGAGKSSIAQTLAAYLLLRDKDPLLVDCDPQRTTAEWCEERREIGFPSISCVELHDNVSSDLIELSKRFGFIVVDCGGSDSKAMRSALAISDVALLPCRPKRRDLRAVVEMADIVETVQAINPNLKVASVITQAPTLPSQGYRIMNAKKLLSEFNLSPLEHITRNLNAWDDAEEEGCSVFEYKEDNKASIDATAVFDELFEVTK